MEVLACLNGETMPVEQARVPVWDRGFLFGDSVYEVCRMYQGPLLAGGRALRPAAPEPQGARVPARRPRPAARADCIARSRRAGSEEGTVYIQITRGVAPRSHAFPDPPVPPTELIVVRPYDDAPTARLRETGVKVISHPDLRWKRCDIKTTNLLANCMATEAARRAGGHEAILVDSVGLRDRGDAHLAALGPARPARGHARGARDPPGHDPAAGPPAASSGWISRSSKHAVTLPELKAADELILVGTTTEVVPIVQVDDDPIASGRPGPVARPAVGRVSRRMSNAGWPVIASTA